MKLKEIKTRWNEFFFKEIPIEGLAIFRILLGLLTLFTFFQDSLSADDLWGAQGLVSMATSMKNYSFPVLNIFQYFNYSDAIMYFFIAIQYIALCFFILGFKTRISTIVVFILLVSFQQRNINILSSADLLIRIFYMLMIFAPIGNAYSVDSIIAKFRGKPLIRNNSCWVHRLLQIQIAVVYISTVISKSKGITWLDGSAVYYATRLNDFTRFATPFILDYKWTIMLITWSTLLVETALGTIIFIDEFRKPLIIIGVLFHLGIEYMMSIPAFELLMIIGLLAMFKFNDYRIFNNWVKNKALNILSGLQMSDKFKKIITKVIV